MKYIDAEKLIAEIERRMKCYDRNGCEPNDGKWVELITMKHFIESNQQEQLSGKQVIIITETDGDANIHWDCRSLEDVRALLASAESYISDKQNEESRGCGSGPDYNTEEGRYSNLFKHRQEQPEVALIYKPNMTISEMVDSINGKQLEVDLEKKIDALFDKWDKNSNGCIFDENGAPVTIKTIKGVVKHFLNARKEK